MKELVALLGVGIVVAGALGVASPTRLLSIVRWETERGVHIAVAIRLGMGVLLLLASSQLRHPDLARLLGVVALLAGVGSLLLGSSRLHALADWWSHRPAWLVRIASGLAASFGLLLAWLACAQGGAP